MSHNQRLEKYLTVQLEDVNCKFQHKHIIKDYDLSNFLNVSTFSASSLLDIQSCQDTNILGNVILEDKG